MRTADAQALRALRAAIIAGMMALAVRAPAARAAGGAYAETKHGNRTTGALRDPSRPRGDCRQCHGRLQGTPAGTPGHALALFAPNDNDLCFACHRGASPGGGWPGSMPFSQSAHALSPGVVWPGPQPAARTGQEAGRCLNCHDPHGVKDRDGVVPAMTLARGSALCLACHRGSPSATDVAAQLRKSYRHPGECSECHDPHLARVDRGRVVAPAASARIAGAARVPVTNGAPGTAPVLGAPRHDEVGVAREYEVCFRCHAAGAAAPGKSDLPLLLNPANASYHPVEAQGRNQRIDRAAFVEGWSWDRLVYCSDCHSSDGAAARGPHGSTWPAILKKRYLPAGAPQASDPGDLCFDCHAWRTYADPQAGAAAAAASRFAGHASHAARGATCATCHEAHGSVAMPALLATRAPGMSSYVQDPQGGSCTVTCHTTAPPTATYRASYAR